MKDLFVSERLVYRSIDTEKDEGFIRAIRGDTILQQLSTGSLITPQKPEDAKEMMKFLQSEALFLSVVICIKSNKDENEIPIGLLSMRGGNAKTLHHRGIQFGIKILGQYQNKGYGPESISWAIDYSFNVAGMHRVQIGAFEFNERALDLYKKLGFKQEGISRESFWHDGRFWDTIQFGMLEREWMEIEQKRKKT